MLKRFVIYCLAMFFGNTMSVSAVVLHVTVHEECFALQGIHITVQTGRHTESATFNRSDFSFHLPDDLITGVSDDSPHRTRLLPNYPNPFNPATTIEFSLEAPAHATLTVYSITGQKVCTLADGEYPAGVHRLAWNGRDDAGRGVSAGVYLCRLVADDFIETRKMMLIDGGGNFSSGASLMTGAVPSAKPAGNPVLILDSITVEKKGYRTLTMENVRLPIEDNKAEIEIEIESENVPGSWFPMLAAGDSMRYGTAYGYYEFSAGSWTDSVAVSDNTIRVLEQITIDDKQYLRFSDWPPFVPEILCVDSGQPLIRIEGDTVYVRFFDTDVLLYDFGDDHYDAVVNFSAIMDMSNYFAEHPDARSEFEDTSFAILREGKGQIISTPGRFYQNCVSMQIHPLPLESNDDRELYFFDRTAGFVFRKAAVDRRAPATLLIDGAIGGMHIGGLPTPGGNPVTGADIAEMLRSTMEWNIPLITIFDVSNCAINPPELFIASDGLEEAAPYLPTEICGIPLTVMTLSELQQRANELGDFPIFALDEDIVIDNGTVAFELAYYMLVDEHASSEYLYGEGFGMEYRQEKGYWIGRIISGWIS